MRGGILIFWNMSSCDGEFFKKEVFFRNLIRFSILYYCRSILNEYTSFYISLDALGIDFLLKQVVHRSVWYFW